MERKIDRELMLWKQSKSRKVLLLRGARQVGKTYSIRQLASSFACFLEVNFEQDRPVESFFEGSLDPAGITEKLAAYFDVPIIPGKTLLLGWEESPIFLCTQ